MKKRNVKWSCLAILRDWDYTYLGSMGCPDNPTCDDYKRNDDSCRVNDSQVVGHLDVVLLRCLGNGLLQTYEHRPSVRMLEDKLGVKFVAPSSAPPSQ